MKAVRDTGAAAGMDELRQRVEELESLLRRSQALYHDFFRQSPIGILVLDMRRAVATLPDMKAADILDTAANGQTNPDVLNEIISSIKIVDINAKARDLVYALRPENRNTPEGIAYWCEVVRVLSRILGASAEGKRHLETDLTTYAPQGEEKYWLLHVSLPEEPVGFERVLVHAIDITDRKQTEDALRRHEQHQQTVAENVSDLVFQATPDGRFLSANPEAVRGLGYRSLNELLESITDIATQVYVHPEHRKYVLEQLREKGKISGFETQFSTKRGEIRWGNLNAVAVKDEAGKLVRIEGFVHDTTEQHRTQDELQRLQAELAHVSRVSTMGEMAAGIAHELNQPLASLKLNAQTCLDLLADGSSPRSLREPLQDLVKESTRAAEIVLRLRKFVTGRPPERVPVSINQLIQEVIKLTDYECRSNGVFVKPVLDTGLPLVIVDPIQIQQVVLNLLRNAVQAVVEVSADQRRVTIWTARTDHDQVVVAVRDNGPGVSQKVVARLFSPFVTTKPYGMGMGLAISHTIVAHHGGRLWHKPEPAGGSVFQFTLPTTFTEGANGSRANDLRRR